MAEMVGRVARAMMTEITAQGEKGDLWNEEFDGLTFVRVDGDIDLMALARAALLEMRVPTQAMRHVVWDQLEKSAACGNLQAGHIAGDGHPDALASKMIKSALTE